MSSLQHIRTEIDAVDQQLLDLIVLRASLAARTTKYKPNGILAPEREKEVLDHLRERNADRLPVEPLLSIMRSIIALCRAEQGRPEVLFLGPRGTFSEMAAHRYFGGDMDPCPLDSLRDVFAMLRPGNYAVVPMTNSIAGGIEETEALMQNNHVRVLDTVEVAVEQCLLSTTFDLEAFTHVYSHRVSLLQCKNWLDRRLPNAIRVAASSNAEAMRMALDNPLSAAIGSSWGAEFYPLHVLQQNIQNDAENTTTFGIIALEESA